MATISLTEKWIIAALLFAAAWGLACSVYERFFLFPQKRLSAVGPAYVPAMTLALFGGSCFVANGESIQVLFALRMAGIFFIASTIATLTFFHLFRWTFRTPSAKPAE